MGYFGGLDPAQNCFRFTHIATEQLFCMFPSILTFNFDLIHK